MTFLRAIERVAIGITLLCLFPACSGTTLKSTTEPSGGDTPDAWQEAALEAHAKLLDALCYADVETLVSLLEPSSDFLIFHPRIVSRIEDVDEGRRGFERMFRTLGAADWSEVHTKFTGGNDVVWFTYHFAVESPNLPEPFVGRATEIWRRHGSSWKLAHGHWSEDPSEA